MPDDTILCRNPRVTADQLGRWLDQGERDRVSTFLRARFAERYFVPIDAMGQDERNGFAMMALNCLVIESLQSYRRGWLTSNGNSELAFCNFFDQEDGFSAFRGFSRSFYANVRCGILHQGETTGGWKIRRDKQLFNSATLTVNAARFHDELKSSLDAYISEISTNDADTEVWKNCLKKLRSVVKNCETRGMRP